MQLDSTERQQRLEREMSLRRDVYLPAIESVIRSQALLGQIGDPNADLRSIQKKMTEALATLAKVHLVAAEPTVRALMNFQKTQQPAYLELMQLRFPLMGIKNQAALEQKFMDRADAGQRALLELMRQHHLSGSTDQAAYQRLNQQVEMEKTLFTQHANNQAVLNQKLTAGTKEVGRKLTDAIAKIGPLIPEVLLNARTELGLPLDADFYRKMTAEQQAVAMEILKKVVGP